MSKYYTPSGEVSKFYKDVTTQTHILCAGATGSGKTVTEKGVINSLIYRPFCDMPGSVELILIDPKGTELTQYKSLPHCIRYASAATNGEMINALRTASAIVDSRFQAMQKNPELMDARHYYKGSDVWVIIDELADLMLSVYSAEVKTILQHIGQIGRAARVHMFCCTQCPLTKVIPTEIKVNFDAIIALRTRSAQDSRNIIGCKGAENFPKVGKCLYQTPDYRETLTVTVPFVDDTETQRLVDWWCEQVKANQNVQNAEISPSAPLTNEEHTATRKGFKSWFKLSVVGLLLVDVIARVL